MALVPKGDIVAELRRRRAECYLLLGRHEEAHTEALAGLDHCRELGDRYEEAATYRVLALTLAALGKPREARQYFEQGFSYYEDIETPFEWGKLWMSYGDWLRGDGAGEYQDLRGALEAYVVAREHFERLGAQAKLAMVNARFGELSASLVTADITVPPPHVSDAPASTPRSRRSQSDREVDQRAQWAIETFGLITRSKSVLHLLGQVERLARSRSPMLILGESGTGKELIARGIHRLSSRKGAYLPINCGALARDVMESELFGHVAGAFTGALRDKPGLFEVCDKGTVFLDEIGELGADLQAKLLRFLETGESRRVGATRNMESDVRVIAATNRERAAIEKGQGFRVDLFYRLAHAVVELPPLRARGQDVELLIEHFLALTCQRENKRVSFSDEALARLIAHTWPGNVRQLRGVVEHAVLVANPGDVIRAETLQLAADRDVSSFEKEMEMVERRRMEDALRTHGGSKAEAARALRMPRTTFIAKMKRYGMS
jgi:two-component system response regulator HydG